MTCIKGDLDEEQPTTSSTTPPSNSWATSGQAFPTPAPTSAPPSAQSNQSLTSLNSSSHLDFNCSPELTNLLMYDFGVTNSDAQWLDDNLVKL